MANDSCSRNDNGSQGSEVNTLVVGCTFEPVETISDRIRSSLATRGWSMRELDRRAEIAEGHTERILARDPERAGAGTLAKIAGALGVTLDWLVRGVGSSETVFVPDERYPNRAGVLAMFQKVDPRARKWLASMELSGTDMRPEEWAKLLFNKEAEFQLMDRDPAAAQAEVQKRRDAAMALADADAAALERKRAELKARKARGG